MLPVILAVLQNVSVSVGPPATDSTLLTTDSLVLASAYLDGDARELVRQARMHRDVIDGSVFRYQATARQRLSVGLRALRRDRLLYRRETASLLDWRRDGPTRIEVLGAREAIPILVSGFRVPDDLDEWVRTFVPRPGDDRLLLNPTGDGFAWHPLADGGEALYRYATGDTTVIRIPDGGEIRLVELRVTPRERDFRVVAGSFWFELDNHALVRAVFRPAREFDLEKDHTTESDFEEVPGILKPVRFDVRYVTVEYGLWEMRWWMPRLMAFDGSFQMGVARFPINVELSFSDYAVEPDRHGLPELPPVTLHLAGDSTARERRHRYPARVVTGDTAGLLRSALLPPSGAGPGLITEYELRELTVRLGALPGPPWQVGRPEVTRPWAPGRGLLRYNRVEGVSVGTRVDWDLGPAGLHVTGRLGTGDRELNLEVGADWAGLHRGWRAGVYHRLAAVDPAARPFGVQNSLASLLLGQDEGLYLRSTGAELQVAPSAGSGYEARLYVERQRVASSTTGFSVFRRDVASPNIEADAATQVGFAARVGRDRRAPGSPAHGAAWLDLTAETGTYTFVRPGVTLAAGAPLPGRLVAAAELAGGTTWGAASDTRSASPVQALWFVGGAPTLRGFGAGTMSGPDFVRGRVELANRLPAARVVFFGDAGWAGRFEDLHARDLAASAGVGVGLLDGLLRLDLARGLRPTADWRVHLTIDGLL